MLMGRRAGCLTVKKPPELPVVVSKLTGPETSMDPHSQRERTLITISIAAEQAHSRGDAVAALDLYQQFIKTSLMVSVVYRTPELEQTVVSYRLRIEEIQAQRVHQVEAGLEEAKAISSTPLKPLCNSMVCSQSTTT